MFNVWIGCFIENDTNEINHVITGARTKEEVIDRLIKYFSDMEVTAWDRVEQDDAQDAVQELISMKTSNMRSFSYGAAISSGVSVAVMEMQEAPPARV